MHGNVEDIAISNEFEIVQDKKSKFYCLKQGQSIKNRQKIIQEEKLTNLCKARRSLANPKFKNLFEANEQRQPEEIKEIRLEKEDNASSDS